MSQLVVIHDSISGERETIDLFCGESLASNLQRLWPRGISGPWRVFRDSVHADNEIAALDLPRVVVAPFQVYVLARGTAADPVSFFINLAIGLALSYIARLLTPKPKRRDSNAEELSPNNALAGQRNQLRPGSRIPEILGKVRSYPDLLCFPAETWTARHQQIIQWFVVGVGDYDVTDSRLGDTPISANPTNSAIAFHPGDPVGDILIVRESPEVSGISLDTQEQATPPVSGVTWTAPNQLSYPTYLAVTVGAYISASGTLNNNKIFTVTGIPPTGQTTPPFVYTLGGPAVVNESGGGASISILNQVRDTYAYGKGPLNAWGTDRLQLRGIVGAPVVGNVLEIDTTPHGGTLKWVGTCTSVQVVTIGIVNPETNYYIRMNDLNGNPIIFNDPGNGNPTSFWAFLSFKEWTQTGASSGGGSGTPGTDQGQWTPIYTVPHENPEQVWVDIEFPQGLVKFVQGVRKDHSVTFVIELSRAGAPTVKETRTITRGGSTSGPLRWTEQLWTKDFLTLAGGTGRWLVRVRRTSTIDVDTSTVQYVGETVWKRLAGVVRQTQRPYPDVTIMGVSLTNDRSATSMGESAFNCLVTRKLPTWTGSGWTPELTATERWADNFIWRCRAADGGRKSDEQIDIAGILALQTQLDAMEGGTGDQGRISMTLDQMQDIDAELTQVADVVRAQVYRVGKKIYVTRDQATLSRIALFNGRTKDPDAESVAMQMTNEGENDGVTVTWVDQANQFKIREYTYTTKPLCVNPARIAAFHATWAQAYRRAVFEWNRIRYRRQQISVNVTEDGRICRPGDVVNITDDIANLAASAGEVLYVSGLVLTLDRDVEFVAGHTYSVLLRDVLGQATDTIAVSALAGSPNKVQLARAPVGVTVKPRDTSLGTLYAFFDESAALVRPWMLTGVSASGPYVQLTGVNYTDLVYQGDSGALPPKPPLNPVLLEEPPT